MAERYAVAVGAGSLRDRDPRSLSLPHQWTDAGVSVTITGDLGTEHVLHLAVACGVLDEVYAQARTRSLKVAGVHVTAEAGIDPVSAEPTGVEYAVAADSALYPEVVDQLIEAVDESAVIPRLLRGGVAVRRVGHV